MNSKRFRECLALLCIILSPVYVYAATKPATEVYFSPRQKATSVIVELIDNAQETIRLAGYSFTSKPIAKSLLMAHKRGVDVKVVLDKSNLTAKYSSVNFFANTGIPLRINHEYAIMHSKYIIIDNVSVQTGSFNYTKAAEEKNAENIVILRNQPQIANQYTLNWKRLWEESTDFKTAY